MRTDDSTVRGHITDPARAFTYLPPLTEYLWGPVASAQNRTKAKFDMARWGNRARIGITDSLCHTAGCACGHGTTIFWRDGLRLEIVRREYRRDLHGVEIRYGEHTGFKAAEQFFGISRAATEYLFNPDYYPTSGLKSPRYVARRIRRFLREAEVVDYEHRHEHKDAYISSINELMQEEPPDGA